jgi:hypothetical protein
MKGADLKPGHHFFAFEKSKLQVERKQTGACKN